MKGQEGGLVELLVICTRQETGDQQRSRGTEDSVVGFILEILLQTQGVNVKMKVVSFQRFGGNCAC